MKIRLGYVAISTSLGITASKTITYTNYKKLKNDYKQIKINEIINQNFVNLQNIIYYNFKNDIHFYRMSHKIIPLATHPKVKIDYINLYRKHFENIGNLVKLYSIRIDTHPDQFCVLNSPIKDVVYNSIKILEFHHNIFKAMKINGKAILHVGGCYGDKNESINRFINNFKKLDKRIQNIIILENDDKIFNIKDTLYICESLNIPMVLDYHHYRCNNQNEDLKEYLPRILKTWDKQKLKPKMHFSSFKNKKEFRSHGDYINSLDFINFIELLKQFNVDVDIMLECKCKDEALFRLTRELKYKTNYVFLNNTTFIV